MLTRGYLIKRSRLEIIIPAANQKLKMIGDTCYEHSTTCVSYLGFRLASFGFSLEHDWKMKNRDCCRAVT